MYNKSKKMTVLGHLKQVNSPLSLPEISALIDHTIPERTLRRWLVTWVESAVIKRTGKKRGTRYEYTAENKESPKTVTPLFLSFLEEPHRSVVLEQIRNLWTHTSTSLEGNTLTLGDTHAILGLGLTVAGKPLREHQEIIGHAKAINLLYQSIQKPLNKELIFALHKAVQTDIVNDIFKPMGAWKVEVNGTNAVTSEGQQLFIEYAHPLHVDNLMGEIIQTINHIDVAKITAKNANKYHAKVHMAVAHIHPFWNGNGRIARLLANIPLLKAGLPPLVIEQSKRRDYIKCLADYQVKIGKLTDKTGAWPNVKQLKNFERFCSEAYELTLKIIHKP